MRNNIAFLQELLSNVADTSKTFLPRSLFTEAAERQGLQSLVDALMSGEGEASGMAIAHQLLRHYDELDDEMRLVFFRYIEDRLRPDAEAVHSAAAAYQADPSQERLAGLQDAVESPRQEFFRRLNMAPGATAQIVAMRKELLGLIDKEPALRFIDRDLYHLLQSWFNRGFLVLRTIDWQTPAAILEKIIQYEAVHEIDGWEDLRRRLDPRDRRCFAFFHPSLVDDPLIFVEVALTDEVSGDIATLLHPAPVGDANDRAEPTTAVFYSISNCQEGLRGVSFGNFLIKQVVDELSREFPSLNRFVTLSPVPRFAGWLAGLLQEEAGELALSAADRASLALLDQPDWWRNDDAGERLRELMSALAAHYFLEVKGPNKRPLDPVARFHLGNGARLERINWLADTSPSGLRQSHGLMVNYLYDTKEIETNHEAYANDGQVVVSRAVRGYLKALGR